MILTPDELRSLVDLKHQSPHTLLGMHPLGVLLEAILSGASVGASAGALVGTPTHE